MTLFTCVGIDFGTSTCCISYVDEAGGVVVIKDELFDTFTIPSLVSLDGLAGSEAKVYGRNVVSNFKRLIGKKANDPELSNVTKHQLIDKNGSMYIVVDGKEYILEEILMRMFNKLKLVIENHVRREWKCVVTIPAYFNEEQRSATWTAIKMSSIPCIKLLNEPSSACIAYLNDQDVDMFNVLVFDFGAGTLDLSVIQVENNEGEVICEVCGVYGDNTLGGIDITNAVAKEFSLSMEEAEEYKKHNDIGLIMERNFGERIRTCIDQAIEISKVKVDQVVLVGGSSKLPWIKNLIMDHLLINPIIKPDNFEEKAVSMGAALHCHHITHTNKIILLDRLPLSLGVNAMGLFSVIVPRNTLIPGSRTRMFTTEEDDQTSVTIDIYQGESKFLENNVKIGSFVLSGIPPCRKGEPVIYVTIKVDVNGIIDVKAREKRGNSENDLRIKRDNLSDELIESFIKNIDKEREFTYNKVHNVMYKLYMLTEKISFNVLDNCVLDYDDDFKQSTFDNLIAPIITTASLLKHYQQEYRLPLDMWNKILELDEEPEKCELRKVIDAMEKWIKIINEKYIMYLNTPELLTGYTKGDKGDDI